MWRPQLVALDVDGTLVDESNVVSAAMRDTIQRVVDAGVPVLLATGRSWASALTVIEQLPFERVEHVCSNGAVLVRYPPFEVTDVLTFDPAPVIEKVRGRPNTAAWITLAITSEIRAAMVASTITRPPVASEAERRPNRDSSEA